MLSQMQSPAQEKISTSQSLWSAVHAYQADGCHGGFHDQTVDVDFFQAEAI